MLDAKPRRPFRHTLLLWFADKIYDLNVIALNLSTGIFSRIRASTEARYGKIANWCWLQLIRHGTEEETLETGNRRLAPLGFKFVRREATEGTTASPWIPVELPNSSPWERN